MQSLVFGVFVHADAVEFIGAIGFTDALHEGGGLRFFAFGLLAGHVLGFCHETSVGPFESCQIGSGIYWADESRADLNDNCRGSVLLWYRIFLFVVRSEERRVG